MRIYKSRTAGWDCLECDEGEDDVFLDKNEIETTRNRAKYHHKKTGHEVHFIVSTISEYKKDEGK